MRWGRLWLFGGLLACAGLAAACSGGISHPPSAASQVAAGAAPPPSLASTSTLVPLPTTPPLTDPSTSAAPATPVPTSPPTSAPTAPAPTTTPAPTAPPTSAPAPTVPPTTVPPPTPPPPIAQLQQVVFGLEPVTELEWPVGVAWRKGDPAMYVIGQLGQVWRVVDGAVQFELVLDLRARTSVEQPAASERGLLGIAFHPADGRMYLDFTDLNGDSVIASWEVVDGVAVPASERVVLTEHQPGPGHNGGGLAFGPAGDLYIGFGDGGGSNGEDARDRTKLLGKVVRIVPRRDGPGYDVPPDNPFVGQDGIRPEIYAWGLRNPWRLSFDAPTGDLWLGDVGNDTLEEIDRVPAGQPGLDFGWNRWEGTIQRKADAPADAVPPVYEWDRDKGIAAVGGYVYRGSAIPELRGAYVFGDLTGRMWFLGADGVVEHQLDLTGLVSFGEDAAGELYLVSIFGDIVKLVPRAT